MSLMVVGTVAFDSIETTVSSAENVLGGSATHFSMAASLLGPVRLCAVVGQDFPSEFRRVFEEREIDLSGVTTTDGRTFRWSGRYHEDMNIRETTDLQLNVIDGYRHTLPPSYRASRFVFLANDHPASQAHTLDQMETPEFVVMDTMDFWIESEREPLLEMLKRVNGVVINDEEARMLTGERNLISAGNKVLNMGPEVVIVKKGEHGAFLFSRFIRYAVPAFPTERVVDPTGAGDVFAGGFMGHLASRESVSLAALKRAMAYGSVLASFCVEEFSVDRLRSIGIDQVDTRLEEFLQFVAP